MKAILVIDTTKCGGCPFCHDNAYYSWCDAPRKERSWEMPLTSKDIDEERTVECPLKPMPQRQLEDAVPVRFIIEYLNKGGEDKISSCLKEWEDADS